MGSRFRYSGRTEFQSRVSIEPRKKLDFERRPSTRYARRHSHLVKESKYPKELAEEEQPPEEEPITTEWDSVARSGCTSASELHVLPLPRQQVALDPPVGLPGINDHHLHDNSMGRQIKEGENYYHESDSVEHRSGQHMANTLPMRPQGTAANWSGSRVNLKVALKGSLSSSDLCHESNYQEESLRNSSPDSGCDMSVMVAYTSEPRVRRPETEVTTIEVHPIKTTAASPVGPGEGKIDKYSSDAGDHDQGYFMVPFSPNSTNKPNTKEVSTCVDLTSDCLPSVHHKYDFQHNESTNSDLSNDSSSQTKMSSVMGSRVNIYPLNCPYSRTGIYSLEGRHLQDQLEETNSDSDNSTSSAREGSTCASSSAVRSGLRPYASTRDILELYGHGPGGQARPLTPRLLGFSSSDLRLPPSALLLSLSGKKAQSTLNIDCGLPDGFLDGAAQLSTIRNPQRRQNRNMFF